MGNCNYAFYSDIGGRDNNEDALLVKEFNKDYLFILADGLGGCDAGEEASKLVVHSVKNSLMNCNADSSEMIKTSIMLANEKLILQQNITGLKMKTTIAVALLKENLAYFANVGDTRIYAFKNNEIIYQSLDHSAAQLAVFAGEIKINEIRDHKDRNILTRALGATEQVKTEIKILNIKDIDSILLCSDGFWEFVTEEDMIKTKVESVSADKWLYKMRSIQLRNAPNNCDNNTAIAVMI